MYIGTSASHDKYNLWDHPILAFDGLSQLAELDWRQAPLEIDKTEGSGEAARFEHIWLLTFVNIQMGIEEIEKVEAVREPDKT